MPTIDPVRRPTQMQPALSGLVLCALACGGLGTTLGSETRAADSATTDTAAAAPILFHPFVLADVMDPATGRPYRGGEQVHIPLGDGAHFDGTVDDWLRALNDLERQYTAIGHSLREDGDLIHRVLKDPAALDAQLLNDLRLSVLGLKDKIKAALADCARLSLPQLGLNVRTGVPFVDDDLIEIERGVTLRANQFVARVNNQQQVFCALGYSLLGRLGGAAGLAQTDVSGGPIAAIGRMRNELLDELGISRFDAKFAWEAIQDVQSYAEIAADVDRLIAARQVPSPEQLQALRQKLNAQMPPDLQIPDLPSIPTPTPARRLDLAVRKRKDWTGLNEGDPSRFNVYATAYYEIRGSETAEEANAEGKAGAFVFGNEINALYGFGQFYAGPDQVRGKLMMRAFGQDLFEPLEFKEAVSYRKADPRLFHFGKDVAYNQQFFIGPIPVTIAAGASAEAYLGYEVVLATTELQGKLLPGADASTFVQGGVGFGGFLSAGAEGSVQLLDLKPVLAGAAGVRFDDRGLPFLRLGLNSDLALDALDGHVEAYAEYPVPRFGLPPWKTKRSTLELFSWAGLHEDYKIMNWEMELTPFGATMSGDLVDQTDRTETRSLQEAIDLDQRRQALTQLEQDVAAKEQAAFAAIADDLSSAPNLQIPVEAAALAEMQAQSERQRANYLASLTALAGG